MALVRDKIVGWKGPVPNIDADHELFWEGLRDRTFQLFRCKRCGACYFPVAFCRNHWPNAPLFGEMEWAEATGRGKVLTYNITEWAFHPGFKDMVPYVYAVIELEEGPIFGSNIVDIDPYKVRIGQPVEVVFQDIVTEDGQEYTLPLFRPSANAL